MFGITSKRTKLVHEMQGQIKGLRETQQRYLDVITGLEVSTEVGGGNDYTSLSAAVNAMRRKYMNQEQWGCLFVQRLVNVRKAMVMPHGLDTQLSKEAEEGAKAEEGGTTATVSQSEIQKAQDVIDRFIDVNDFNEGMAIELAKEGELEGNVLLDLSDWDKDKKTVKVIYRSLKETGYTPNKNKDNPSELDSFTWEQTGKGNVTLKLEQSAFIYFNGLLNGWKGVPTTAPVLTTLENLHKTLHNWHRFNELYGKVTPVFETEDPTEAARIQSRIDSQGWKQGHALIVNGSFDYKSPQAAGVATTLEQEITIGLKIIAGHTGVGPHNLGFPDLMSNRATAESMGEPTEVVAIADIALWRNFYEDLFDKVIAIHNESDMAQKVRPGLIKPELLPVTDRQWDRAINFWIPAAERDLVSEELFLQNIPGIDATKEIKRLNSERVDVHLGNSTGQENDVED